MRSDPVVDVAEAGGLHRERAAVVDRRAVQVLIFEGAEEALDDAVGLRRADTGADVTQQRVAAGEGGLVDLAAEARAVIGHDRNWSRDDVDDLAGGLVDEFQLAAVGAQIVEVEHAFGLGDGGVQAGECVGAAAGWGDLGGEAVLGGVVDDGADAPDPTGRGLAVGPEPARQQQPAAAQRPLDRRGGHAVSVGPHQRRDLAVTPGRPIARVLGCQRFDRVDRRCGPRPLGRLDVCAKPRDVAAIGALRGAGQRREPRDRQLGCFSQGLEVCEGI